MDIISNTGLFKNKKIKITSENAFAMQIYDTSLSIFLLTEMLHNIINGLHICFLSVGYSSFQYSIFTKIYYKICGIGI